MKVDTFVQFLQKFWFNYSLRNYRETVEVINNNPHWVNWVRWYSRNYTLDLRERAEAPFKGAYDIHTIKEAQEVISWLQEVYRVGYNDGYDYCDKNRPSC